MVYVTVNEETPDLLYLSRGPGLRSWSVFVGVLAVGLGAAFYSTDYFLWKFVYLSCTMFIALSTLDDWEECILDKTQREIHCSTLTILYKLFKAKRSYKKVSVDLDDIVDVVVDTEVVKYGTTAYMVVLRSSAGFSVGVTQTATSGPSTEHEFIADKIRSFLELDKKMSSRMDVYDNEEEELTSDDLEDDSSHLSDHTSSAQSDESFEKIDHSELQNNTDSSDIENLATEPEKTAAEPEITAAEPEITAADPEITAAGPEITAAGPEITAAGPEITATDLEKKATESESSASEPEKSQPENTAAELENMAGEPKNTAACTEPESTVTEPKM